MALVYPRIVIDPEYAQHLDHFSVNPDCLRDYLRDSGMSSHDISETTLRFSSERIERFGKRVLGRCYRETATANVYRLVDMRYAAEIVAVESSPESADEYARQVLGATAIHELTHRLIWTQPVSPEKDTFIQKVAEMLGELEDDDLTPIEEWIYLNNPDEQRCNDAEQNVPDGLINVRVKRV